MFPTIRKKKTAMVMVQSDEEFKEMESKQYSYGRFYEQS